MAWQVIFHIDFRTEFMSMDRNVQTELMAAVDLLRSFGPSMRRPYADTLSGSKYSNMKELRFYAGNGVWRAAFAFDPKRQAVVLVAGDKVGGSQSRFYKTLIARADMRFSDHLSNLKD
jgi:hypothetical protein